MSCPFKHLWGARPDDVSSSPSKSVPDHQQSNKGDASCSLKQDDGSGKGMAPPAGPPPQAAPPTKGRCPFGHGSGGSSVAATDASSAAGARAAQGGTCPFGHGAGSSGRGAAAAASSQPQEAPAAEGAPAAEEPQPAVCPYGFGGGKGQRMTQFHCVLCRSLYYDCVVTSCNHRFCAGCISRFADCPLCGADISSATSDPDTQALVEQFIKAHGVGPGVLQELEGTAHPVQRTAQAGNGEWWSPPEESGGRAAFLLQLGLRAMSAGNLPSARHRLTQCRQQLLQELQAQQAQQTQHAAGETASSALSDLHLDEVAAEQLQRQAAAGAAADAALDAPKPGGQQEGQAATGADNGAAIGTPATNSDGQLEGQKGGQQQQGEEERQQQQQGEEGREEKRQQQQGGEEWEREAALRSRLGAVCGCLGDAARGSGEWEGAAAYYAESVGQLRLAGGSGEAQHALSITLNKLGELHHMRGDLEAALPLYQQSLGIRRQRLAALALQQQQGQPGAAAVAAAREAQQAQQVQEVGEAQQGQQLVEQAEWCAAAVDVAVGCLKVADALQALGRSGGTEEAGAALQEAASLVAQVELAAGGDENTQTQSNQIRDSQSLSRGAAVVQLPASLLAKLAAVKAHLARQSQAPA